ncbi:MAG: hypothetical protein AB1480_13350 [Nitrospirota bacterium]
MITYFANEVDAVAKVIEDEFSIDVENSVDKRALLDPDRFGYLSLHYIAKLSERHSKLTEYKRFSGLKFEIQMRSILQHVWAEIWHDLGYKSRQSVPKEIQRCFSRLAGLLEIADDEFIRICNELQNYENTVSQKIAESPINIYIDKASLQAFINEDDLVKSLDSQIAEIYRVQIVENPASIEALVSAMHYFSIETITDIRRELEEFKRLIVSFAENRSQKFSSEIEIIQRGESLFYLCCILAAGKGTTDSLMDFLNALDFVHPEMRRSKAEEILSIYEKVMKINSE